MDAAVPIDGAQPKHLSPTDDTAVLPSMGAILAEQAEKAFTKRAKVIQQIVMTSGLSVVICMVGLWVGWDYYDTIYKPNQTKEREARIADLEKERAFKDSLITHMNEARAAADTRAESDRTRNQEIRMQTDTLKEISTTTKESLREMKLLRAGRRAVDDEQGRAEHFDPGPPGTQPLRE